MTRRRIPPRDTVESPPPSTEWDVADAAWAKEQKPPVETGDWTVETDTTPPIAGEVITSATLPELGTEYVPRAVSRDPVLALVSECIDRCTAGGSIGLAEMRELLERIRKL